MQGEPESPDIAYVRRLLADMEAGRIVLSEPSCGCVFRDLDLCAEPAEPIPCGACGMLEGETDAG